MENIYSTIDRFQVKYIHFRDRIETLNYSAIWLKCMIFLRVFKVFARVVQVYCYRFAFLLLQFYEVCANPRFSFVFPTFLQGFTTFYKLCCTFGSDFFRRAPRAGHAQFARFYNVLQAD